MPAYRSPIGRKRRRIPLAATCWRSNCPRFETLVNLVPDSHPMKQKTDYLKGPRFSDEETAHLMSGDHLRLSGLAHRAAQSAD